MKKQERENIENYWRTFYELCSKTEAYAGSIRKGRSGSGSYYLSSLALVEKLNQMAGLLDLPMMGDSEEDPEERKKLIQRETSLLLNRLFDDEIRKAYLAEADKLQGEIVSLADLQMGALAKLGYIRKKKPEKTPASISKEVGKAKKTAEKAELKAEKKAEKAELKAERKAEKAWQKAANA